MEEPNVVKLLEQRQNEIEDPEGRLFPNDGYNRIHNYLTGMGKHPSANGAKYYGVTAGNITTSDLRKTEASIIALRNIEKLKDVEIHDFKDLYDVMNKVVEGGVTAFLNDNNANAMKSYVGIPVWLALLEKAEENHLEAAKEDSNYTYTLPTRADLYNFSRGMGIEEIQQIMDTRERARRANERVEKGVRRNILQI